MMFPNLYLKTVLQNNELIESDPLSTPDTVIQENSEVEVDIMENKVRCSLFDRFLWFLFTYNYFKNHFLVASK